MKVRWLQTYDCDGVDGEKVLQQWDEDAEAWVEVTAYRIPEYLEEQYDTEDYC